MIRPGVIVFTEIDEESKYAFDPTAADPTEEYFRCVNLIKESYEGVPFTSTLKYRIEHMMQMLSKRVTDCRYCAPRFDIQTVHDCALVIRFSEEDFPIKKGEREIVMGVFRKKPVEIKAEQFNPKAQPWPTGVVEKRPPEGKETLTTKIYWIETLEGGHVVTPGDWIITGVKGEKYPCKDDIFRETYDAVDDVARAAFGEYNVE